MTHYPRAAPGKYWPGYIPFLLIAIERMNEKCGTCWFFRKTKSSGGNVLKECYYLPPVDIRREGNDGIRI